MIADPLAKREPLAREVGLDDSQADELSQSHRIDRSRWPSPPPTFPRFPIASKTQVESSPTLAAMVKNGDQIWFIKLKGDRDVVAAQEDCIQKLSEVVAVRRRQWSYRWPQVIWLAAARTSAICRRTTASLRGPLHARARPRGSGLAAADRRALRAVDLPHLSRHARSKRQRRLESRQRHVFPRVVRPRRFPSLRAARPALLQNGRMGSFRRILFLRRQDARPVHCSSTCWPPTPSASKSRPTGKRLYAGLATIAAGVLVTYFVIRSGMNQGVESELSPEFCDYLWQGFRGLLAVATLGGAYLLFFWGTPSQAQADRMARAARRRYSARHSHDLAARASRSPAR